MTITAPIMNSAPIDFTEASCPMYCLLVISGASTAWATGHQRHKGFGNPTWESLEVSEQFFKNDDVIISGTANGMK